MKIFIFLLFLCLIIQNTCLSSKNQMFERIDSKSYSMNQNKVQMMNELKISMMSEDTSLLMDKFLQQRLTGDKNELEGLPDNQGLMLQWLKKNYNKYAPINYYDMDQNDPQYQYKFFEQIFHNNTNFFQMPKEMQEKRAKVGALYGFPSSQQQENVNKGYDPAYIQQFHTKVEQDFYRKYYIDGCYEKFLKNKHEKALQIKRDAMRFLRIDQDSDQDEKKKKEQKEIDNIKIDGCVQPIRSPVEPIYLYHCWASSVLDRLWRFEWWCTEGNTQLHQHEKQGRDFAGYPCETWDSPGGYRGAWISGVMQTDHPVFFKWDYLIIQMINMLDIKWLGTPKEWTLQTTQDMAIWEDDIQNIDKNKKWQGEAGYIKPNSMWFVRGHRLKMTSNEAYVGFSSITAYRKEWTVVMSLKAQPSMCITRQEPDYFTAKSRLMAMQCIDAITMGDSRDVFTLSTKFEVLSYMDKFCLTMGNNPNDDKLAWLDGCDKTVKQKVQLDRSGKITSFDKRGYCLAVDFKTTNDNVAFRSKAQAKSSNSNPIHSPSQPVSGTNSWWQSGDFDEQNEWSAMFGGPKTCGSIYLEWKYPPNQYDILLNGGGGWEPFMEIIVTQNTFKAEFQPRIAIGIKLVMKKFDPVQSKTLGNKLVYGLQNVKVHRGGFGVQFKNCDGQKQTMLNRFQFTDVEFLSNCASKPAAELKSQLGKQNAELLEAVKETIKLEPQIEKLQQQQQDIENKMDDFEQDSDNKDQQNQKDDNQQNKNDDKNKDDDKKNCPKDKKDMRFKGDNFRFIQESQIGADLQSRLQNYWDSQMSDDESSDEEFNVIGSDQNNPATDCQKIQEIYPCSRSGYYWIQPRCADIPIKVFCDFETGSMYIFYGKSELEQREDINQLTDFNDARKLCSKLGLQPLEYQSEKQTENVLNYLSDIKVKFDDGFIPFGWDYGCAINKCTHDFRSLNDQSSSKIIRFFRDKMDSTNPINRSVSKEGVDYIVNALGLLKSGKEFTFVDIKETQVLGLICSDNNNSAHNQIIRDDNSFIADCKTKGSDKQLNPGVNKYIRVKCPKDCTNIDEALVYGDGPYASQSSVCRAAVQQQIINDRYNKQYK